MNAMTAPDLAGRDLLGAPRVLPRDLPADPAVAVFGFREPQQIDIDAWVEALPSMPVLEVVLIPRRMSFAAPVIEGGMAR